MVSRRIMAPLRAEAAAAAAAVVGFLLVPGATCIEDVCEATLLGVTVATRCPCAGCLWAMVNRPDSSDDTVITVAGELSALPAATGVTSASACCSLVDFCIAAPAPAPGSIA